MDCINTGLKRFNEFSSTIKTNANKACTQFQQASNLRKTLIIIAPIAVVAVAVIASKVLCSSPSAPKNYPVVDSNQYIPASPENWQHLSIAQLKCTSGFPEVERYNIIRVASEDLVPMGAKVRQLSKEMFEDIHNVKTLGEAENIFNKYAKTEEKKQRREEESEIRTRYQNLPDMWEQKHNELKAHYQKFFPPSFDLPNSLGAHSDRPFTGSAKSCDSSVQSICIQSLTSMQRPALSPRDFCAKNLPSNDLCKIVSSNKEENIGLVVDLGKFLICGDES